MPVWFASFERNSGTNPVIPSTETFWLTGTGELENSKKGTADSARIPRRSVMPVQQSRAGLGWAVVNSARDAQHKAASQHR
eukprot:5058243-Pyramimonas_sp.AAC.1